MPIRNNSNLFDTDSAPYHTLNDDRDRLHRIGDFNLKVRSKGLLSSRCVELEKVSDEAFVWNDLVLLARFGVRPEGFHAPFLRMLQLSGKCRAMVFEPVVHNKTAFPNMVEMLDALDAFDLAVNNLVASCCEQNRDQGLESALRVDPNERYHALQHAVVILREDLIRLSRGQYKINFDRRILVNLEDLVKETEEGLFLSQVNGQMLVPSLKNRLSIKISSSQVLCRRELQRLVLALHDQNGSIVFNQLAAQSLSVYCPSQVPTLRASRSVAVKKHALDSFLVISSFWLSSLVNPMLQQTIDIPFGDVVESCPSWLVWSAGIVTANVVFSLAGSCVKSSMDSIQFMEKQTQKADSQNAIDGMQADLMMLIKLVKEHQTAADQYVVAFGDVAHRLSDTAVNSWQQTRLCMHLAYFNMPIMSEQSKQEQLRALLDNPDVTDLSVSQKALVRHVLMKDAQVESFRHPELTVEETERLMTWLCLHEPEFAADMLRVNLAKPFHVLAVKELAHSMYLQNISSGTQGALGVLLSLAMAYNCVMYENGVGRSFGQVFSNGFIWESFSSVVMSWQLFVALLPTGSESVSARFYGFLWRNRMPLVSGLSLLHDLAWLAKQYIPFLADEVEHKAGKIEAIFLMGVFVKMLVLLSLFLSSKEGESVLMRSVFALVHTVSLLMGAALCFFTGQQNRAFELLNEAVSFVLNGVFLGSFKGVLRLFSDMMTMLVKGGLYYPFREAHYDSCRLAFTAREQVTVAGQGCVQSLSRCAERTEGAFSQCAGLTLFSQPSSDNGDDNLRGDNRLEV